MAVRSVRGTNREDQFPLEKQCAIGGEERVACVVDAGRFRGSTGELYDLKIAALFEILFVFVAHIVSPNEKAGEFTRNPIDHALEFVGAKMHSIAKDAALRMIAGLDKFYDFARGEDLIATFSEPPKVSSRHQHRARISASQF